MILYIIEATSAHKLYYALETDKKKSEVEKMAEEMVNNGTIKDFAQKWQGEKVDHVTKVSKETYLHTFDKFNIGQKTWTDRAKLNEVNRKDKPDDVLNEDEL